MSDKKHNWKDHAIELSKDADWSWRRIARYLGISKSTMSDTLRKYHKGYIRPIERGHIGSDADPKVLIFDLELSFLRAAVYRLWNNQHISLKQLEDDWHMLSFAAKWWGGDEIFYFDQRNKEDVEDDRDLLISLCSLINQADVLVGFNSQRFDTKKLNTRLIIQGLPQPKPYKQIDLYRIAKEKFSFTSNSLAYISKVLVPHQQKSSHGKYPGIELWQECLRGNKDAWEENEEYNKQDVRATEALLDIMLPWSDRAVNLALFKDEPENLGMWEHISYTYTSVGKYKLYRHKKTGKYMRSRVNEFSKEKRESLLANV